MSFFEAIKKSMMLSSEIQDENERLEVVKIILDHTLKIQNIYKAPEFKNTIYSPFNFEMSIANAFVDYYSDDDAVLKKYGYEYIKNFIIHDTNPLPKYLDIVHRYEPSYNPPVKSTTASSSGGCYVATAVYGSYDCPEVWTLRRFRDYDLAEKWYGRAFIRTYYAISPTIVKWFGNTDWFKNMWRGTLDNMVSNLQNKGYESTPYNDREW